MKITEYSGMWQRVPGSAKRFRNVVTGEEISYRQARKRGIAGVRKEEHKIPIRYPGVSKNRPYSKRKEWLKGLWQLEGKYVFENDKGYVVESVGWSRNYPFRDLEVQRREAINYALSQLKGSGWYCLKAIGERWLRR